MIRINIIFLLFLFSMQSYANIIVSSNSDIKTIKQAVEIAKDGETILIKEGLYEESDIVIEKSLKIIGEDEAVIKAKDGNKVFIINSDNVLIKNLTIKDMKTSYIEDISAIKINNSNSVIIENNTLINTFFGIYAANCTNLIIRDNNIISNAVEQSSSANGIHLWKCKNILVENNHVEKHRDGIYFEFVKNSLIKNNYSKLNLRYGLHFMFSDNNRYYKNRFEDNGAGVAVMYSNNIEMIENDFVENWGTNAYGLLLKEIKDSKINNNLFKTNTIGIFGESVIRCQFEHNDFMNNGWALKFISSSEQNNFLYNNFIGNTFDLATNKNSISYNVFKNNYWSSYNGYDLNKDGIGDKPHKPVDLFSTVISDSPVAIILLRSMFVDMMNFAEKIVPVMTPAGLEDLEPMMKEIKHD